MNASSTKRRASSEVPKRVQILGRDYELKAVPGLLDSQECYGLHHPVQRLIEYDPDVPHIELKDTILHEVIHGVDSLHCIGLTEQQTTVLATGLVAVFKTNPDFAKFILT